MDLKHRVERSFKPRFAVIYPFAVYFLLFGAINSDSLRSGIGYIIAGLLIRLWSNGYAIKNDKLTISGPYSLVRNPLYVGTFLIALGFVFALQLKLIEGILFLSAMIFMYYNTVQNEQKMLSEKFGQVYKDYCAQVPALLPRLTPYTSGEQWPFSLDRLIFSKEYKTGLWMTVIIIALYLKTHLLMNHKPMTEQTWSLVLLAAFLVLVDIFYEMNKTKKKNIK